MGSIHVARLFEHCGCRTVEIDDAIRAAAAPQVVNLGAGLDSRAWRMSELRDVVVFEVDHPHTQRDKRSRVASLIPVTRDLRFVPVNFERDHLDAALAAAGHDTGRPTTWIWEGVVQYLGLRDIHAVLEVLNGRSAPGSRLIITYHAPAFVRRILTWVARYAKYKYRSHFKADEMRAILAKYDFNVVRDRLVSTLSAELSSDLARTTRWARHIRVAIAERATGS